MASKRNRTLYSKKRMLVQKSREAALSAVQIFNNPLINFKSETFIVLMVIAWTYLMHAYYQEKNVVYKYFTQVGKRRIYDKTRKGAYKHWELEKCISVPECPLDTATKANLNLLIGVRHEIEHQMTTSIDSYLSSKFQACCMNYNKYIKELFGEEYGIDRYLSFSIQFSTLEAQQFGNQDRYIPKNITTFVQEFESNLEEGVYEDQSFAVRLLFTRKIANRPGQADKVIEFVDPNSEAAKELEKEYWVVKDREKPKFKPGNIVSKMHEEGYIKFNMRHHTNLWQSLNAKKNGAGYGAKLFDGQWYWYENWVDKVRAHCNEKAHLYR